MMRVKQVHEPGGCSFIASERNRYFTGKYMTARDFQTDQMYFLSRHRLHNRLLHGWGVVCGLQVLPHPDPDCRNNWVVVGPGVALDCCGRELALRREIAIEIDVAEPENGYTPPTDDDAGHSPAQQRPYPNDADYADVKGKDPYAQDDVDEKLPPRTDAPPRRAYLLCIHYHEEDVEPVPVLRADAACRADQTDANRVRESVTFATIPLDDVDPTCWRQPAAPHGDVRCRRDCDDDLPGPAGACLEPECPCGACVPLALITLNDPGGTLDEGFTIDMAGRRTLPTPPEYYTHIISTNWPHGGTVTLSQLRAWKGRLEVRFDRPIKDSPDEMTGINRHTFTVEHLGVQGTLQYLGDPDHEPVLQDDCVAVFNIEPRHFDRGVTIAGGAVYVKLKCDFILDCHLNPVDGNHIGGRLPSGNGTRGGVFESWFGVVHDEEAKGRA